MFGLYVSNIFLFTTFFFVSSWAQKNSPAMGVVINEGAIVYQKADFDSKKIGIAQKGKQYIISKKIYGAFHRIQFGKVVGYIADIDVRPVNFKRGIDKNIEKKIQAQSDFENEPEQQKKRRPFSLSRYVGFFANQIEYQEDTMGKNLSEKLNFFGMKMSGTDVFIDGDSPSEINLIFFNGAPTYYEKNTGQSADGFMVLNNYLFLMNSPWSKTSLGYFGFGPLLRFSKFNLNLKDPNTGRVNSYVAQDAALGISFEAGAAFRIGPTALRIEAQYHWEKYRYMGLGLALQFPF